MVYLMFSTGHKSGGFNDQVNITDADGNVIGDVARTYEPESLYATEIGSKNELWDKRMTANFAAFWYMYNDQQFQSIQATGPAFTGDDGTVNQPLSAVRFNAASSRIIGLEADVAARLPARLKAGLAAQVLYARFTEGTVADTRLSWDPAEMTEVDLGAKGYTVPRAPTLTLNYSLGQAIPTSIGYFDWILSAQTKTKYYMTVFNGDGKDTEGNVNPNLSDSVPSYTRFDAGVGYTHINGKLRVDAFVNNLTDVVYMTTIINAPNLNLRFFNPPRQFGTRVTVYF
jgi:iron complex outermembrane receptor protein